MMAFQPSPQQQAEMDAYFPCSNGIHICGADPAEEVPVTVSNFPCNREQARRLYDRAKAEIESERDPADLVVDLQLGGDCDETFWIDRQMLQHLEEMWVEELRTC